MAHTNLSLKLTKSVGIGCLFSLLPLYGYSEPHTENNNSVSLVANNWCPQHCETHPHLQGYIVEIVQEALLAAGKNSTVDYRPWLRAIHDTTQDNFDGLLTPAKSEATQLLKHSIPIAFQRFCFYKLKSTKFELNSLNDFKNKSISFADGNNLGHEFMNFISNKNNKVTVKKLNTNGEGFANRAFTYLTFDRTDAIAITEDSGDFYLGEHPELKAKTVKAYCTTPEPLHVGLSTKDNQKAKDIAQKIDEGIQIIQDNGKYKEILNKYHLGDLHYYAFSIP